MYNHSDPNPTIQAKFDAGQALYMRITTAMLRQLEQSISNDAEAEVRIYAGGCDIRVRWAGGLREANINLDAEQLAQVQSFRDEKMQRAWDRLIIRFQALRDQ